MSDTPFSNDTTENLTDLSNSIADDSVPGEESEEKSPSRLMRVLKTCGWIILALGFLIFFTILKLPQDRIRNYVQGEISSVLSSQRITLTAAQSSFSIGFGISYTMKDVTLRFPPPQEPVKIDQITVSPSLLTLFTGKAGAQIRVDNKGGTLKGFYSQPLMGPTGPISASFKATNLDLGSLGLLPLTAGIKGSAVANGEGQISGDLNSPNTLDGKLRLALSRLVIDPQSVMGFSIPRLTVSSADANVNINHGKAIIQTFKLGKPGSTSDDIIGTITGDVVLGRNLPYSTLNLKTDFRLSQNVLKSFVLLDAILGAGKQPDGSYAFTITGPLNSPMPAPVSAGAAPHAGGH